MVRVKIEREYIFSEKKLKQLLKLKGSIMELSLWSGLSPKDEEAGVSNDKTKWMLKTFEVSKEE